MSHNHLWQPEILDLSSASDKTRWESLQASGAVLEVYDTLDAQVAEWAVCHEPSAKHDPTLLANTLASLMADRDWDTFGVWVHYPWSGRLVHVLPEEAFVEVRTNRNREKISKEETQRLRNSTVGIAGLSVGQSTAIALAMERACGTLRLADYDVVELSNMNRIRCGLHELELPKWVVAARAIAEFDPFLNIEIFDEGVNRANVEEFVSGCDVVVDACDGLSAKALLRMEAYRQGIPVVMDTNDRGMLDIERYDIPAVRSRGFVHGRIDEATMAEFAESTAWSPAALDAFVDVQSASDRGRRSLAEVGKSLVSWPQTYTGVAAGGAHAAEVCRRLALGESLPDIRIYMDLHEQLTHTSIR